MNKLIDNKLMITGGGREKLVKGVRCRMTMIRNQTFGDEHAVDIEL